MNRLAMWLAVMIGIIMLASQPASARSADAVSTATGRTRANFNADWRFQLGDWPQAKEPAFDDSGWQSVGTPHSFGIG